MANGRAERIVLASHRLPSAPSPMKNFRASAMLATSPAKSGQRSLNPTPSKPRYPTLALLPVLLGVYGSAGSSESGCMAGAPLRFHQAGRLPSVQTGLMIPILIENQ